MTSLAAEHGGAERRAAEQGGAERRAAEQGGAERRAAEQGAARRERKKRQTRDALIHAALRLFEAKGYENTAVHEITDAVDVSERTFFRYFANKEDLALSFINESAQGLLKALAARPPEEAPLTALRAALRERLRQLGTTDGGTDDVPAQLSVIKLIDETPSLLAAQLRYTHDHNEEIVRVLAEREGVDPETDLRPRIVAAMFGALVVLANRDWRTSGEAGIESMLTAFDAYADQLGPALFEHWGPREDG